MATHAYVEAQRARSYSDGLPKPPRQAWMSRVPDVCEVELVSSRDGSEQSALFFDSESARAKPLLVVLHSWSSDHLQSLNIPYAEWAKRNDWVFIHPEFRGRNSRPEATASDLAVQDVVDAVNYAKRHARVDEKRIYATGYSGGGMMALFMAGRHPELWAGVVAWAPVSDLVDWYEHNRRRGQTRYARDIVKSCGGIPSARSRAERECHERSPLAVLNRAKSAPFPVYIAHGIRDRTIKPSHALWAFNALAAKGDRFSDDEIRFIASRQLLPPHLRGPLHDPLFSQSGAPLELKRRSGNVTLALFRGGHDVLYNVGLRWLSGARRLNPRQSKRSQRWGQRRGSRTWRA